MPITRIILDSEPRLPIDRMYAMLRGAIVNGAQEAVTAVTVHDGHQFSIGDKALYALDDCNILVDRVMTCTATAADVVTFAGNSAFTYPDGARLVNIGTDTGGVVQIDGSYSRPNWDGSSILLYSDSNGDDIIPYVSVRPDGRAEGWSSVAPFWALYLSNGLIPVKVLVDAASSGSSGGGPAYTRSASAPGVKSAGDTWDKIVNSGASPDIRYTYMNTGSDVYDWVEEMTGEVA